MILGIGHLKQYDTVRYQLIKQRTALSNSEEALNALTHLNDEVTQVLNDMVVMATFITFSGFPFFDKRSYSVTHCLFFLLAVQLHMYTETFDLVTSVPGVGLKTAAATMMICITDGFKKFSHAQVKQFISYIGTRFHFLSLQKSGEQACVQWLLLSLFQGFLSLINAHIVLRIVYFFFWLSSYTCTTLIASCFKTAAATMMICITDGFKKFSHAQVKQFISYIGMSPITFESGTSVKGRAHISKEGNSRMRSMLYMCSWTVNFFIIKHTLLRTRFHFLSLQKSGEQACVQWLLCLRNFHMLKLSNLLAI
jgi:hypothetical protein